MDFKRRKLLVTVKDLHFTHPHYLKSGRNYLLRALLILPRTNVESREALRILESGADGVLIGEASGFHHQSIFKQTVEGPFALGLQLSEAVDENSFSGILSELASTTLETAGSLLAAQAVPPVRSGIRRMAGFFAGKLGDKDPAIIAEAYHPVTRVRSHSLNLALLASEKVSAPSKRSGAKSRKRGPARVLVQEGDTIASARIQLKYFS